MEGRERVAGILIIDDDPEFGQVLAEVVKSLGHTPSWAINLAQGVEMASRVKPEVVFLDVFLPDGNGLDAVAPLKDTPSRPEVIVVTGPKQFSPPEGRGEGASGLRAADVLGLPAAPTCHRPASERRSQVT